jgi:hypothetical protein
MRLPAKARKAAAALFCLLVWFAASNHCALGSLASARTQAPSCAHCAAKHPGKASPADADACCKGLRATALAVEPFHAASLLSLDVVFSGPLFSPAEFQAEPQRIIATDTGPPDALSFAETVLKRSLRAHAPPARV